MGHFPGHLTDRIVTAHIRFTHRVTVISRDFLIPKMTGHGSLKRAFSYAPTFIGTLQNSGGIEMRNKPSINKLRRKILKLESQAELLRSRTIEKRILFIGPWFNLN